MRVLALPIRDFQNLVGLQSPLTFDQELSLAATTVNIPEHLRVVSQILEMFLTMVIQIRTNHRE